MVQQRSFDVSQHGLPSFTNSFVYLGETVTFLSSKLDELQNLADKDNRFVHFQVIPNASSLPALPEAANVMNAQPFVEPKSESLVPFTIPEKASLLGSIFGFKPSTSTSTSVATTAPPASTTTITASQTQDPSNAPVMQATTNMMAVPPMAPFAYGSQVMSDEQFARELQAKMNLEAVANAPPPPPRQG